MKAMKIPLPGGDYLEPDDGPRDTLFHRRILRAEPIPHTRAANLLHLDCGHTAMAFGDLKLAGGVVLCQVCRDQGN